MKGYNCIINVRRGNKMWFDWQPKPHILFEQLERVCLAGEYRVVQPESIPAGIISPGLLGKTHSVLILCSGTITGRVYTMMNFNRVDNNEIDQMPYAIAFDGNEPIPSGVLIQHAKYPGRTSPLPKDFYEYISESGAYPLREMPSNSMGKITDLKIGSQEEAFRLLISKLASEFPENES